MNEVTKQAALSAVRTLLAIAGSVLVTHGVLNDGQVQQAIGAVMALIPLGWGVWNQYNAEKKTRERVTEAYNAGSSQMPMPTTMKESKP